MDERGRWIRRFLFVRTCVDDARDLGRGIREPAYHSIISVLAFINQHVILLGELRLYSNGVVHVSTLFTARSRLGSMDLGGHCSSDAPITTDRATCVKMRCEASQLSSLVGALHIYLNRRDRGSVGLVEL